MTIEDFLERQLGGTLKPSDPLRVAMGGMLNSIPSSLDFARGAFDPYAGALPSSAMSEALRLVSGGMTGSLANSLARARGAFDPYADAFPTFATSEALRLASGGLTDSLTAPLAHARGAFDPYAGAFPSHAIEEALRAAEGARNLSLPSVLDPYRASTELLATQMISTRLHDIWGHPETVSGFVHASALSNAMYDEVGVSRQLREASNAFLLSAVPTSVDLHGYGRFLEGAGLRLRHWPNLRLLSRAEKRRRFRNLLHSNRESPQIRKAKSLVHRYEATLRELIDDRMAATFGEDWQEMRLPQCKCKGLLGKASARGGTPLNHADYHHYANIMSHPEHFDLVFSLGFDDANALSDIVRKAGKLRARSHHPSDFTNSDLRELRVVWKIIEKGLLALTNDYEMEFSGNN